MQVRTYPDVFIKQFVITNEFGVNLYTTPMYVQMKNYFEKVKEIWGIFTTKHSL